MTLIEEARAYVDAYAQTDDRYKKQHLQKYQFAKALIAADTFIDAQRLSGISRAMIEPLLTYDAALKE